MLFCPLQPPQTQKQIRDVTKYFIQNKQIMCSKQIWIHIWLLVVLFKNKVKTRDVHQEWDATGCTENSFIHSSVVTRASTRFDVMRFQFSRQHCEISQFQRICYYSSLFIFIRQWFNILHWISYNTIKFQYTRQWFNIWRYGWICYGANYYS